MKKVRIKVSKEQVTSFFHYMGSKEFLWLNFGILISTMGTYFFKFPNNFSIGGVSGISVILGALLSQTTPASLILVMNLLLLVLGFCVFGKGFGAKTAYASVMMSVELWVVERFFPMTKPFTNEPMLELVFAVMLPAFGAAMLFNIDASTGGTDIIAMVLKKFSHVNIGNALLISDAAIVLWSFFVFDIQTGLFSLLGLAAKALVVDNVIESINLCKYFTIITSRPDEVCEYIVNNLSRGATKLNAVGAFTNEEKTMVITVVRRFQAVYLQRKVRLIDPQAFILITNTSEIIGKGFRGIS